MKTKIAIISFALILMFGCGDDSEDLAGPIAEFEVTSIEQNEVTFTNLSTDYTSVEWDFGDGTTANVDETSEINPFTYTYSETGTYTVTLTAHGEGGMSATNKSVTISSVPAKASATISSASDIGATFFTVNYTLVSGESNFTDYYLQISKTQDFAVLEDIDPFMSGSQQEAEINATSTSKTVSNLIPGQQYFCRIRINIFTPGAGDEIIYSEAINATTIALPEPSITAEIDSQPFDFQISSSLTVGDPYPVSYDIEIVAARDADFTDIVSLERRPVNNVYYREPGTNLYIKAIATVNGKASEKVIEFNTAENYLTGNDDFNSVGTDAILSQNNTVLTIGNGSGERIEYHFAQPVAEGDSYIIQNGTSGEDQVFYFSPSGVTYELNNNTGIATLHFYKISSSEAHIRLGSATDSDLRMFFQEPGTSNTFQIWGLIAKATIQ